MKVLKRGSCIFGQLHIEPTLQHSHLLHNLAVLERRVAMEGLKRDLFQKPSSAIGNCLVKTTAQMSY